jgi:hypothetical protein
MSTHLRGIRALVPALLVVGGLLAPARADDKVIKRVGNETQTLTGTVVRDDLEMVLLVQSGAEIPVRRPNVAKVIYGNAPSELEEGRIAIEQREWVNAFRKLRQAGAKLTKLQKRGMPRANLIWQYVYYYLGRVRQEADDPRIKNPSRARVRYEEVISSVENSVWFFDAKLGAAQALAESGSPENVAAAKEDFRLMAKAFENKAREFRIMRLAEPRILEANAWHLRLQVEENMDNAAKLADFNRELEELTTRYSADEKAEAAVRYVQAKIWRGQERWAKLVGYLDDAIQEAQLKNRANELFGLYRERAFANFSNEDYRAALVDYLRLHLEYAPDRELSAEINLRMAQCLIRMEEKEDEWKRMAKQHLADAKRSGVEPFKTDANELLKTLQDGASDGDAEGSEQSSET